MLQRLLSVLAALPGLALLAGSALTGGWADENGYAWLSRACVVGAAVGLAVAVVCLAAAILPRTWRQRILARLDEGQARQRILARLDEGQEKTVRASTEVSWGEAARVAALCWVLSGVLYAGFAAIHARGLSPAPLLSLGLARWFVSRPRDRTAGALAAVAGAATLFGLVDALRPPLGRYVADALATGSAVTVALVVLVLGTRFRRRLREGAARERHPAT
ncbi:hypothetical protein [Streptomyces sp. NPDC013740]|uniref:hypothetical protein n=1 Tax=Streptomyces sp. NPDC013740 TaxID=3364867 RepID=UPI0036F7C404